MNESGTKSKLGRAETTDILKLLPHRYPFLLVDRIVDMVIPGERQGRLRRCGFADIAFCDAHQSLLDPNAMRANSTPLRSIVPAVARLA